jgi:hypothetical protein
MAKAISCQPKLTLLPRKLSRRGARKKTKKAPIEPIELMHSLCAHVADCRAPKDCSI